MLPSFPGEVNRVRCFSHVVNLVAKSLIRQFDAEADKDEADDDVDARELAELAEGLEREEQELREKPEEEGGEPKDEEDDDPDYEVDAMAFVSDDEREQFLQDIRPVKLVLAKVRQQACYRVRHVTLTLNATAPQADLQDHQLYDHPPARLEGPLEGARASGEAAAA